MTNSESVTETENPTDVDPDVDPDAGTGSDTGPASCRPAGPRRFRRRADGAILAGVAAGVAEYFDLDVTLVRVALVALTFLGGAAIPCYVGAWLLVPEEGSEESVAGDLLRHLHLPRARAGGHRTTPPTTTSEVHMGAGRDGCGRGPRQGWSVPDPTMRVSDAERNDVADALSTHYAEGRLDSAEFKERMDAATSAKTRGDLAGLMTDLPPLPGSHALEPRPPRRVRLWEVALVAVLVLWALPWTVGRGIWVAHVPWLLVAVVAFVLLRRRHRARYQPGG